MLQDVIHCCKNKKKTENRSIKMKVLRAGGVQQGAAGTERGAMMSFTAVMIPNDLLGRSWTISNIAFTVL